jgi:hypothetical protein
VDSCSPEVGPQRPRYRLYDGVVSGSMPVNCTILVPVKYRTCRERAKTFAEALEREACDLEKVLC